MINLLEHIKRKNYKKEIQEINFIIATIYSKQKIISYEVRLNNEPVISFIDDGWIKAHSFIMGYCVAKNLDWNDLNIEYRQKHIYK